MFASDDPAAAEGVGGLDVSSVVGAPPTWTASQQPSLNIRSRIACSTGGDAAGPDAPSDTAGSLSELVVAARPAHGAGIRGRFRLLPPADQEGEPTGGRTATRGSANVANMAGAGPAARRWAPRQETAGRSCVSGSNCSCNPRTRPRPPRYKPRCRQALAMLAAADDSFRTGEAWGELAMALNAADADPAQEHEGWVESAAAYTRAGANEDATASQAHADSAEPVEKQPPSGSHPPSEAEPSSDSG